MTKTLLCTTRRKLVVHLHSRFNPSSNHSTVPLFSGCISYLLLHHFHCIIFTQWQPKSRLQSRYDSIATTPRFQNLVADTTFYRPHLALRVSRWVTHPLRSSSLNQRAKRTSQSIHLHQSSTTSTSKSPSSKLSMQRPKQSQQWHRQSNQRKQMSPCFKRTLTASFSSLLSTMRFVPL